jgi:drug/metabolite transporter (DMT)-like permease
MAGDVAVPDGDPPHVTAPPGGDPRLRLKIVAAFATIYLVWGSTFLAIRIGLRSLPPTLFAGSRFLLAGTLLTVVAIFMRERFPRTAREWRYLLLFSLLMITFSNGLSTQALRHLPSNEGALLSSGSALWIAWLGALGPKGHKLTVRGTLGLLLGFVGVGLLVWPRETTPPGHFAWQSLVLIGSLCWAIGTILYRNAALAIGPVAFNAVMMLLGGTWLLLGGILAGELPLWTWRPGGIIAMGYLAVFGSALAYTAYTWLLKHSPADRVGTFAYVNPAIATVLGWAVLGEALGPAQVAGMLVVLAGVALVTLPGRLA